MDPKRLYGTKTVEIPQLSGSEDENLSDNDFYRKRTTFSQVLVEDTSEQEQLDREPNWILKKGNIILRKYQPKKFVATMWGIFLS
ncbi:unnamed protein product, partial [Acanthoscelides obtectus]